MNFMSTFKHLRDQCRDSTGKRVLNVKRGCAFPKSDPRGSDPEVGKRFGFEERIVPVVTSRLGPGGSAAAVDNGTWRSSCGRVPGKGDRTGLPASCLVEAG